jgi:hypothetical protein
MRMRHAATLGAIGLAGMFAGEVAVADGPVRTCEDGSSINFSKFENVNKFNGVSYRVVAEDFDAKSGRFNLRITPAAGLSETEARFQAQLSTGVICLQFESPSAKAGAGQVLDDAWLFASGCEGKDLQMALKC